MTYLSRLAKLGAAKETTPYTYTVPTVAIPFTKAAFEDVTAPIRDETIRTNDAVVQGIYAGAQDATWDIETYVYPDVVGHFLRGIIGPDTATAGVSTVLSALTTAGASSITTTASIPLGSTIAIDTGELLEYAVTGAPTGAGPYVIPITTPATGLTKGHASGATVVAQTTHTFTQSRTFSTVWPTYSITVNDGGDIRGFPGMVMSDLQLKIDPKGALTANAKYVGFPSATVADFTPSYTSVAPILGWSWNMVNAGGASTRGLTYDITAKRAVDVVHSSDGTQGPREVFPAALEVDGQYKAIYENNTDLNLFTQYSQQPATATVAQPLAFGGMSLAVTMSKTGWHKGVVDLHGSAYVQASFDLSGIYNSTDNGIATVVLKNFQTTAY